jgi:hypothetical protein
VNVKFQLILSKHSWFRSLRFLSEVGSDEKTLSGMAACLRKLNSQTLNASWKCQPLIPSPIETADVELIDILVTVKLYIFFGSRPRSPASLPRRELVASMDTMAGLESQVGDVLKGGG